jgi:hypothetical protein
MKCNITFSHVAHNILFFVLIRRKDLLRNVTTPWPINAGPSTPAQIWQLSFARWSVAAGAALAVAEALCSPSRARSTSSRSYRQEIPRREVCRAPSTIFRSKLPSYWSHRATPMGSYSYWSKSKMFDYGFIGRIAGAERRAGFRSAGGIFSANQIRFTQERYCRSGGSRTTVKRMYGIAHPPPAKVLNTNFWYLDGYISDTHSPFS